MYRFLLFIFLIINSSFSELNSASNENLKSINVNGYAAIVNNEIITHSEVRKSMRSLLPNLYKQFEGNELESRILNLYQETLLNLIHQELIYSEFNLQGGQIPDTFVKDEIKNIKKKNFNNNEIKFEKFLTDEQKTYTEYFEEIRKKISIQALISQNVNNKIEASPKKIYNYYVSNKNNFLNPEKIKYSVFEIHSSTNSTIVNDQKEANTILEQIKTNKNIIKMKKLFTDSENKKIKEFPWMQIKDIPHNHLPIIENLNKNEFSEVIKLKDNFSIFFINDKIEASYTPFTEVKDSIKNKLLNSQKEEIFKEWIKELEQKNFIKIFN